MLTINGTVNETRQCGRTPVVADSVGNSKLI